MSVILVTKCLPRNKRCFVLFSRVAGCGSRENSNVTFRLFLIGVLLKRSCVKCCNLETQLLYNNVQAMYITE